MSFFLPLQTTSSPPSLDVRFSPLIQVSYTATSITLSDKRRFPNFLRVIPSDTAASATVMNVVREFDWEQVAIVTHINAVFSNVSGGSKCLCLVNFHNCSIPPSFLLLLPFLSLPPFPPFPPLSLFSLPPPSPLPLLIPPLLLNLSPSPPLPLLLLLVHVHVALPLVESCPLVRSCLTCMHEPEAYELLHFGALISSCTTHCMYTGDTLQ